MQISEFDFSFPSDQIAQFPLPRGEARMMIVDRQVSAGGPASVGPSDSAGDSPAFSHAKNLEDFLAAGDALVLNDTKVIPARLKGTTSRGTKVEALLIEPRARESGPETYPDIRPHMSRNPRWEAMLKPAKRCPIGTRIEFPSGLSSRVLEIYSSGTRLLQFDVDEALFPVLLEQAGSLPLPPYLKRDVVEEDKDTYQSVFAENPGAVAAPTASLHLTLDQVQRIANAGVKIVKVTLHVGAGTFKPVQCQNIEDHPMHSERYRLSSQAAAELNEVRRKGGKIWAVGTTCARVLESQALGNGADLFTPGEGKTDIFIFPGYRWRAVDGLLTNFHWPKSTLFMLVCSLVGTQRAQRIYADAVTRGFRLFSYGDAMLIR